ncbi:MCP four helix bundle domain-containing protein, partial [Desulfosporosinus sp. PR]|uniref:MCP four helix bundle domain-containing protein n=1 Tax=Candidatus Desulfosporosinus nitrosoreducens TaxID=3401928 RepID=UPI0027F880F8
MKIRTKLLGSILIVIIIFLLGNIFTLSQINQMQTDVNNIDQKQLPSMMDVDLINMDISDVQRLSEAYVLETSDKKEDLEKQLNATLDEISQTSNRHQSYITTAEERQLFAK